MAGSKKSADFFLAFHKDIELSFKRSGIFFADLHYIKCLFFLQKEQLVDKAKDLSEEDSEAHIAKLIRFV